ncbi:MAG: ABC transporter substrate-binding protein [Cyclobacteriaceae bacterium]
MSKKGIIGIIILVLVSFSIWYYIKNNNNVNEGNEIIKIGVIMPLTGPLATFGNWARHGIEQYQSSNPTNNIQYIFEDSKFDAKTGINAYNKLVEIDNVEALVVGMSKIAIPIIPLAEKDEIPLLLQDVTFPNVTKNRNWVLRHFIQSDREAQVIARYAIEALGLKSFGILSVQDEAGIAAAKAFEHYISNVGSIVGVKSFENSTTDYKSIIQPILNNSPDGIYLFGNGPSWTQALKTIKEFGYDGVILTNTAMYITPFRNIAGEAANGVYFTFPYISKNSSSGSKFISDYINTHNEFPSIEAAYSYDLATIIAASYFKSREEGIQFKAAFLNEMYFEGAFGSINIPNDKDIITPLAIGFIESDSIVIKKIISENE